MNTKQLEAAEALALKLNDDLEDFDGYKLAQQTGSDFEKADELFDTAVSLASSLQSALDNAKSILSDISRYYL